MSPRKSMFEDAIKQLIETAANRAANLAVQQYAEKTAAKAPKYGERMTVDDLCKVSHKARQTIYQLNSRHVIPGSHHVGGKLLFYTSQVLPWIENGCPTIMR